MIQIMASRWTAFSNTLEGVGSERVETGGGRGDGIVVWIQGENVWSAGLLVDLCGGSA